MVLIGARGVVTTPTRGRFHCPHCGAARTYAHRKVRPMLTFLYVPVAQRGEEREFVQCGFCRRAFHPSVLDVAPPLPGLTADPEDDRPDWRISELTGDAASTLLTWDGES